MALFSQDGIKHETTGLLKVISPQAEVLEEYKDNGVAVYQQTPLV